MASEDETRGAPAPKRWACAIRLPGHTVPSRIAEAAETGDTEALKLAAQVEAMKWTEEVFWPSTLDWVRTGPETLWALRQGKPAACLVLFRSA